MDKQPDYPTVINSLVLIQKKLVRIITCSPYRAHTEPLMYANKMLSVTNINMYLTGIFMYQCVNKETPELFLNFFCTNSDFHDHDTRHAADLYVPYGRLDIRKFSIIIHGANVWNSIKKCPICTRVQAAISQLFDWNVSLLISLYRVYELSPSLLRLCLLMNHVLHSIHVDLTYLFHLTLKALWKSSESINRLTMLKCTLLLTPVFLLITLVNEEVITYRV